MRIWAHLAGNQRYEYICNFYVESKRAVKNKKVNTGNGSNFCDQGIYHNTWQADYKSQRQ